MAPCKGNEAWPEQLCWERTPENLRQLARDSTPCAFSFADFASYLFTVMHHRHKYNC